MILCTTVHIVFLGGRSVRYFNYNPVKKWLILFIQLPLFKNYLTWKCLHFWYKYIRRKRFNRALELISTPMSLFVAYIPMMMAAMEVSDIVWEVVNIVIYDGSIVEENTLEGFKEQQVCFCIIFVFYFTRAFTNFLQEKSTVSAIQRLKKVRHTVKSVALNICLDVLKRFGFTVDDSYDTPQQPRRDPVAANQRAKAKNRNGRDGAPQSRHDSEADHNPTSFAYQRAKLRCCHRLCNMVRWVDNILQSRLLKNARKQVNRFENDVRRHFKYLPGEDLLDGDDVRAVLEGDRSSDDPKVCVDIA